MTLDDQQRKKVAAWVAEGMRISEIQSRISSEFKISMTYMDVRLLVDDLKVVPKDAEPPKPPPSPLTTGASAPGKEPVSTTAAPELPHDPAAGNVSVVVDQLARPGAIVSGKVTFSDGQKADWYLDQSGRLGLVAQQQGYRPPAEDVQKFQIALETELSKLGF